MPYGFTYSIFHWAVHLSLAFLFSYFLQLDFYGYLTVLLSTILIDLDHLPVLIKEGMGSILQFSKPRKLLLHNLYFLSIVLFISVLNFFLPQYFLLNIILWSTFLHIVWDLFEDVLIFKMGIKHWL